MVKRQTSIQFPEKPLGSTYIKPNVKSTSSCTDNCHELIPICSGAYIMHHGTCYALDSIVYVDLCVCQYESPLNMYCYQSNI